MILEKLTFTGPLPLTSPNEAIIGVVTPNPLVAPIPVVSLPTLALNIVADCNRLKDKALYYLRGRLYSWDYTFLLNVTNLLVEELSASLEQDNRNSYNDLFEKSYVFFLILNEKFTSTKIPVAMLDNVREKLKSLSEELKQEFTLAPEKIYQILNGFTDEIRLKKQRDLPTPLMLATLVFEPLMKCKLKALMIVSENNNKERIIDEIKFLKYLFLQAEAYPAFYSTNVTEELVTLVEDMLYILLYLTKELELDNKVYLTQLDFLLNCYRNTAIPEENTLGKRLVDEDAVDSKHLKMSSSFDSIPDPKWQDMNANPQ